MKFNEFKPIITEEQALFKSMLVEYLEGSITKQDLIVKLHEHGIDEGKFDALINLAKKGFAKGKGWWNNRNSKQGSLPLGNPNSVAGKVKGAVGKVAAPVAAVAKKPGVGTALKVGGGVAVGAAGVAAIDALSGDNKNDADASPRNPVDGPPPPKALTPKAPKPGGEQSFGQAFGAARKAQGGPGGKFSYKGKEYQTNIKGEKYAKNPTAVGPNKTLALQQKLKAAGADIKADGLMGPNTRAAMKKYGIGQSKPAAPAPARPSTPVQSGGAGGEFAAPAFRRPEAQPPTAGKADWQMSDDDKAATFRPPAAPAKPKPKPTGRLPKFQPGTMSV